MQGQEEGARTDTGMGLSQWVYTGGKISMNKDICFVDEFELNLYLDRELGADRQQALDDHIIGCSDCSLRHLIVRHLKGRVRDCIREAKAPVSMGQQILERIESLPDGGVSDIWGFIGSAIKNRPLLPIGIAAALVVGFLSTILLRPSTSNTMELVSAMVQEHDEYIEYFKTDRGIVSADPIEVAQWLSENGGVSLKLSNCGKLPSIAGACSINEGGKDVACLFFDKGEKRVSFFMALGDTRNVKGCKILELKDKRVFCGRNTGSNYALWEVDGHIYILVSKLPEESLIQIAENLN